MADWDDGATHNSSHNLSGAEKRKVLEVRKDPMDCTGGGGAGTGRHCKGGSKGTFE